MSRATPLVGDDKYSLLQEVWDHGTPGKLWDSALVTNTIFKKLFELTRIFSLAKI